MKNPYEKGPSASGTPRSPEALEKALLGAGSKPAKTLDDFTAAAQGYPPVRQTGHDLNVAMTAPMPRKLH